MSSLSSRLAARNLAVGTGSTGGSGGTGTVNVSGSAVTLDTVAALNSATIDVSVNYVRTAGFYTVGDPGAGAWRRKTSGEPDVAGDQTSNGGTVRWEIIIEKNALQFFQFGAKGMNNYLAEPTPGADDDAYRYIVMADKYIYQKNLGGVMLEMPSQVIYFSKAHNMKRMNYHLHSSYHGVLMRNASYEDCFMINYQYGNGHDYAMYMNNFGYNSGTALYKNDGQTGAGNVYRCVSTGTSALSGDTLNGSDPNATYTDGTSQWKFETYIGPNGANPYDYYLGTDRSAGNSCIENFQFWSFWDNNSSDPNVNKWPDQHGYVKPPDWGTMVGKYNCAVVERVRALLKNIFITQYPGFGIGIAADGDPCLTGPGNVNGFHNDHIVSYFNGKSGLHIGYADANAGTTVYLDTAFNGRHGYEEWSFLGNYMSMHQAAADGYWGLARKQYPSGVLHNGFGWVSRLPISGLEGWPSYINEEPGGSNNAWIKYGGDGTLATGAWGQNYPDWSATQRYEPGGGFSSNNINARNVFVSMYIEGGTMPSQPCANDILLGGLGQDIDGSRGALLLINSSWSFLSANHLDVESSSGGDNLTIRGTRGMPTGTGGDHEVRFNKGGGTGDPLAYQYYNSTWNAVGGTRP